jgi:hypothetical protein
MTGLPDDNRNAAAATASAASTGLDDVRRGTTILTNGARGPYRDAGSIVRHDDDDASGTTAPSAAGTGSRGSSPGTPRTPLTAVSGKSATASAAASTGARGGAGTSSTATSPGGSPMPSSIGIGSREDSIGSVSATRSKNEVRRTIAYVGRAGILYASSSSGSCAAGLASTASSDGTSSWRRRSEEGTGRGPPSTARATAAGTGCTSRTGATTAPGAAVGHEGPGFGDGMGVDETGARRHAADAPVTTLRSGASLGSASARGGGVDDSAASREGVGDVEGEDLVRRIGSQVEPGQVQVIPKRHVVFYRQDCIRTQRKISVGTISVESSTHVRAARVIGMKDATNRRVHEVIGATRCRIHPDVTGRGGVLRRGPPNDVSSRWRQADGICADLETRDPELSTGPADPGLVAILERTPRVPFATHLRSRLVESLTRLAR